MKTLGVAIIAFNEEKRIGACLDSAAFASEIVVLDSGSTDNTLAVARSRGARAAYKPWAGYSRQKQAAVDLLTTDWILVLDADEEITAECRDEIKNLLRNDIVASGFRISRYHDFMGRILRHGKGVDAPIRLFKKNCGQFNGKEIHEEIEIAGTIGKLANGLIHHSSPTLALRLKKIRRDCSLEVRFYSQDAKTGLIPLLVNPIRYFMGHLIHGQSWKDGIPGLFWLASFSYGIFRYHLSMMRNKETPS
jgi:glycosyltransferase involved in cell wall biosynthesis